MFPSPEWNSLGYFFSWTTVSSPSRRVDARMIVLCLHVHRGSAIAKIVGANAAKYDKFDTTVNMWVFEEMVNGRKLTEIINTDHENVKYLPGHKLPPNVVSLRTLFDDQQKSHTVFCLFDVAM